MQEMSEPTFHGDKPQTRDLSQYFAGMSEWVSQRLGGEDPARMSSLEPTPASANGFAGESFILEVVRGRDTRERTERYLLKRKPTQHRYFPDHDFDAEYRVQALLAKDGRVPMAPVIAYEPGPEILGSPFYLLGFVDGRPLPDQPFYYEGGWLMELPAADQRAICVAGLTALAAVHAVPLMQSGAGFLHRAKAGGKQIDWDLAYWDRFGAASWTDGPIARVGEGREWLERNKPDTENLVISWGDSRPGNMMFNGTRAIAVIDWDMASSGDPEKDLGYWLAMDLSYQRFSERGGGLHLTGWPSRKEMVEIYEQAAGKPVDRKKLRYHRIFAGYQIACMFARYVTMRKDLDASQRAQFLNSAAPPIDLIREELDAAHLPGCAT
jgi:aminoglycoside phosphotransferase (APT) family kinase protein